MKERIKTNSGFSLIEVTLVTVVLLVAMGALGTMITTSKSAYQVGSTRAQLEERAPHVTDVIVEELMVAGLETLDPDPAPGVGADTVSFRSAVDVANGNVVWGPLRQLRFEYEAGEVDNGLDDNGNGLVDEGRVVLTEDLGGPDERDRVLSRWVREHFAGELENGVDDNGNGLIDESGFFLERSGESVVVRLTLEKSGVRQPDMERAVETSVRLRN